MFFWAINGCNVKSQLKLGMCMHLSLKKAPFSISSNQYKSLKLPIVNNKSLYWHWFLKTQKWFCSSYANEIISLYFVNQHVHFVRSSVCDSSYIVTGCLCDFHKNLAAFCWVFFREEKFRCCCLFHLPVAHCVLYSSATFDLLNCCDLSSVFTVTSQNAYSSITPQKPLRTDSSVNQQ